MNFLESDLEKIIMKSKPKSLMERGLTFNHYWVKNQVKIGNYGISDIVAFDRASYETDRHFVPEITVYELKKGSVSISGFLRAVRYVKGISRWIEKPNKRYHFDYNYNIVLIGKVNLSSDIIYLPDLFYDEGFNLTGGRCSVQIYDYDYGIDGIEFKHISNYCLTNEGFSI